jgi:plastocyanin
MLIDDHSKIRHRRRVRFGDRRSSTAGLTAAFLAAGLLAAAAPPALAESGPVTVLVRDADGAPVADAVVFAPSLAGEFAPPEEPYVLDQVDKEYVPHILPIVVGGQVRFPNSDDIHHHVYSFSRAKKFELPLYRGEPADPVTFEQAGVVKVGCNIHDWMSAVILVLPNPHFAMTNAEGRAVLEGLPREDGVVLQVFHERLRGSSDATAKTVAWRADGTAEVRWEIRLRPAARSTRSALDY